MIAMLQQLGSQPSVLAPRGAESASVATLTWALIWIAAAVGLFVFTLLFIPLVRRPAPGGDLDEAPGGPEVSAARWVGGGGIAMTGVILLGVFVAMLVTMRRLDARGRTADVEIQVVGHRWWWEVRYPAGGRVIVTANEIHLPLGRTARIDLSSDDVIHSLWVPQLGGKTDLVPSQHNEMWLAPTEAGVYEGQCAEFCGPQHAHMDLVVVAEPADSFAAWLAREALPGAEPADPVALEGRGLLLGSQCPACHTIRGTAAAGVVGPDLTHFGSRPLIGAGALPNDAGSLAGWIDASSASKPNVLMPPVPMSGEQVRAVTAYLESLK